MIGKIADNPLIHFLDYYENPLQPLRVCFAGDEVTGSIHEKLFLNNFLHEIDDFVPIFLLFHEKRALFVLT